MKVGDKLLANNGESDFISEVTNIEGQFVYFENGDDEYYTLLDRTERVGHIEGVDVYRADCYEG